MKRLLQISLDTLLISILPIMMWIILGFTVDKNIANVFSLTYPLQFFYMIFLSLFAVGPNITSKKNQNDDIVYSNMIFGTVIVGILTLLLIFNVNLYIQMMNMEVQIYHNFCAYSIIWMYLSFIVQTTMQKLYYDGKNGTSNKINLIFNLSNFILIILSTSLLEEWLGILIAIVVDSVLAISIFVKYYKRAKFSVCMKDNIKYTSFSLLRNIGMFLIYGIGFSNSFSYGENITKTINFESLTTDTQWDMLYSIDTASKIDLADNKFDYKESLINAYKLIAILISTSLVMNVVLIWYFKPDVKILVVLLAIQFADMLLDPLKTLRLAYIQINDSNKKHNIFYALVRGVRLLFSFLPTAFCTYIGQIVAAICQLVYSFIVCRKCDVFKRKCPKT